MKHYLQFEFAKNAPSLFENGMMRKNSKSVLGALIKGKLHVEEYKRSPQELFVVDGGKFLQCGHWLDSGTYDICLMLTSSMQRVIIMSILTL